MAEVEALEAKTQTFAQQMVPLELAAASLMISQRHLAELMLKYGYSIYHLGPKSKRISAEDLQSLLKLTSAQQ